MRGKKGREDQDVRIKGRGWIQLRRGAVKRTTKEKGKKRRCCGIKEAWKTRKGIRKQLKKNGRKGERWKGWKRMIKEN